VDLGGNRSGNSSYCAPVRRILRRIQRTPSRISRLSRRGRRLPSGQVGGSGKSGSNTVYCASASFTRSSESKLENPAQPPFFG
jgi:hypothetical protein